MYGITALIETTPLEITTTTDPDGLTTTTATSGEYVFYLYDHGGPLSDVYITKPGRKPFCIYSLWTWDYETRSRLSKELNIWRFTQWLEEEAALYVIELAPSYLD